MKREVLGREARQLGKLDRILEVQRVADAHVGCVDQPDHIAGERFFDGRPLLAEHGVRVLGREGLAGATVGEHHASLEHARAHADERDAVAVRGVHVGLHLEHETRHRRIERAFRAFDIDPRWR